MVESSLEVDYAAVRSYNLLVARVVAQLAIVNAALVLA